MHRETPILMRFDVIFFRPKFLLKSSIAQLLMRKKFKSSSVRRKYIIKKRPNREFEIPWFVFGLGFFFCVTNAALSCEFHKSSNLQSRLFVLFIFFRFFTSSLEILLRLRQLKIATGQRRFLSFFFMIYTNLSLGQRAEIFDAKELCNYMGWFTVKTHIYC